MTTIPITSFHLFPGWRSSETQRIAYSDHGTNNLPPVSWLAKLRKMELFDRSHVSLDMPHQSFQFWCGAIIEENDSTFIQQMPDIIKIKHGLVKGVGAVDIG
jgi:hypothetical protein